MRRPFSGWLETANKVKEMAVTELRASIQDQITEPNELGFNYLLAESGSETTPRPRARKSLSMRHND
jgi:hypothetical protein